MVLAIIVIDLLRSNFSSTKFMCTTNWYSRLYVLLYYTYINSIIDYSVGNNEIFYLLLEMWIYYSSKI